MTEQKLLVKGYNTKMGPEVYSFNLPALKTCTPTSWCLEGRNGRRACYALRNCFMFPDVKKRANLNYTLSQKDDFSEKMIDEIKRRKVKYLRFHSSGDFYSIDYIKKIREIAKNCQDTLFRTSTRRRDFKEPILDLNSIPNFIVRESLDSERPVPKMNLPFAALSYLPIAKESFHCIDDCVKCGYHCWNYRVSTSFDEL